ncbi:MAG: phenylphosphate carboxylase subunit delta [Gemmatimonadetes bacterium]|nr:phenylphosphate carboxylase subunit delta [Gemmatimonadota bacterium]
MAEASMEAASIPFEIASRISLVIFDVDGVLTDAGVWMSAGGRKHERKRFDIQDGLGLKLLESAGVKVVLVSGRVSPATTARAGELELEVYQDAGADKLPLVDRLRRERELEWDEVAMLADDLPDASVFTRVGLPAAVSNAIPLIRDTALWVSTRPGGHGAAREFCDALLRARGDLARVVATYVDARGGVGLGPAGRAWPKVASE